MIRRALYPTITAIVLSTCVYALSGCTESDGGQEMTTTSPQNPIFPDVPERAEDETPFQSAEEHEDEAPPQAVRARTPEEASRIAQNNARMYIEAFRKGQDFIEANSEIQNAHEGIELLQELFVGGKLDAGVVKMLEAELTTGGEEMREAIVEMLGDVAKADPLKPKYTLQLRSPEIIGLLAGPVLAKSDGARFDAMRLMSDRMTVADLAPHGKAITRALIVDPDERAFLLVAKAKPPQAKKVVWELYKTDRWNKNKYARIAWAAYGNKEIEDEFIEQANEAEKKCDGKWLGASLMSLAQIGTRSSLRAVAKRMRSPIIFDKDCPMSVRLEVMDALSYAYPDEAALESFKVRSIEDYRAAEKFCTRKLGVRYTQPEPEYLGIWPMWSNEHPPEFDPCGSFIRKGEFKGVLPPETESLPR